MKERYTIGEFCKLFGLNVQTLYYYDQIGLFTPQMRDPRTNRRYYAFDQVYNLASIRFMRKLGYSIPQVQEFFESMDVENSIERLRIHSEEMRKQWAELFLIDTAIQRKLHFVSEKMRGLDTDSLSVRWFPERRYIPIGEEEILYHHDSFYLYPTVVFYRDGQKFFGASIDTVTQGIEKQPDGSEAVSTEQIPEGDYLCAYHVGPYELILDRANEVRKKNRHLTLADELVNFNIVDQFVASDPKRFITEMQIRIL